MQYFNRIPPLSVKDPTSYQAQSRCLRQGRRKAGTGDDRPGPGPRNPDLRFSRRFPGGREFNWAGRSFAAGMLPGMNLRGQPDGVSDLPIFGTRPVHGQGARLDKFRGNGHGNLLRRLSADGQADGGMDPVQIRGGVPVGQKLFIDGVALVAGADHADIGGRGPEHVPPR